jgi:putative transposase
MAESFFATLKKELTRRRHWPSLSELHHEVATYVTYFNATRRHSRLGYLSPADFEKLAA